MTVLCFAVGFFVILIGWRLFRGILVAVLCATALCTPGRAATNRWVAPPGTRIIVTADANTWAIWNATGFTVTGRVNGSACTIPTNTAGLVPLPDWENLLMADDASQQGILIRQMRTDTNLGWDAARSGMAAALVLLTSTVVITLFKRFFTAGGEL